MLDWLFRKKKGPPQPGAAGTIPAASRSAGATPTPAPPPAVDWQDKLARATGDDDALLALASGPAPVDIKLAAVAALASEEALKRAERELRKHDRRVYRLAKQRHAELLARRETRGRGGFLLDGVLELSGAVGFALDRFHGEAGELLAEAVELGEFFGGDDRAFGGGADLAGESARNLEQGTQSLDIG